MITKGEKKYGDGVYLEFQSAIHHDIASNLPLVPFAVFSLSVVPTIKQNSTECTFLAPACEENNVIRDGCEIGEEGPRRTMGQRSRYSENQLWIFRGVAL
jgi:hypothetical protein